MDTNQLLPEGAETGGPSIAEELLRAIMENPQSTQDKVCIILGFSSVFSMLDYISCHTSILRNRKKKLPVYIKKTWHNSMHSRLCM